MLVSITLRFSTLSRTSRGVISPLETCKKRGRESRRPSEMITLPAKHSSLSRGGEWGGGGANPFPRRARERARDWSATTAKWSLREKRRQHNSLMTTRGVWRREWRRAGRPASRAPTAKAVRKQQHPRDIAPRLIMPLAGPRSIRARARESERTRASASEQTAPFRRVAVSAGRDR